MSRDGLAWKRFLCLVFGHGTDQNDGRPGVVSNIVKAPDGRLIHTHDYCERCEHILRIADQSEFIRWWGDQWTITDEAPVENQYSRRQL